MRKQTIVDTAVTLARTVYNVNDLFGGSPMNRGNQCVLAIVGDAAFAAGDVTVETDNAADGSYTNVFAGNVDSASEWLNVTLGDNIAVTVASRTAGSVEVFLLGDS